MARPKRVLVTLSNDDDGIAASQTPAAGGAQNLTIGGVLAAGGVATLPAPHLVIITSAGNDSGRTFTIYGTDFQGNAQSENVTGANAGAATSTKYYKTVTRVAVDADTAGAVKVGTVGKAISQPIPLNWRARHFNVGLQIDLTGTANFDVQSTFSDIQDPNAVISWVDDATLANKSADITGSIAIPCRAVRLQTNSGNDATTLAFHITQNG